MFFSTPNSQHQHSVSKPSNIGLQHSAMKPLSATQYSSINCSTAIPKQTVPLTLNYDIERTDILGTLGTVIIASDSTTHSKVALQTINNFHPENLHNNVNLPSQIYLLKKLSHPNILACHHYSHTGTNWLLVLEYNPRCVTLSSLLAQSFGGLSQHDTWCIIIQLLSAVTHCINRGVDHRDITTDNILIDPVTMQIKLYNFSKAIQLPTTVPYTHPGYTSDVTSATSYVISHSTNDIIINQPTISSSTPPEYKTRGFYQPLQGIVWSIGLILFQLLSGSKPPTGDINWSLMANARSPVSEECLEVVLGCLERQPERRMKFSQLGSNDWVINEIFF